jgi:hypothetical protein
MKAKEHQIDATMIAHVGDRHETLAPLSRGLGVGGQTSHMIAIIYVYQY